MWPKELSLLAIAMILDTKLTPVVYPYFFLLATFFLYTHIRCLYTLLLVETKINSGSDLIKHAWYFSVGLRVNEWVSEWERESEIMNANLLILFFAYECTSSQSQQRKKNDTIRCVAKDIQRSIKSLRKCQSYIYASSHTVLFTHHLFLSIHKLFEIS